MNLEGGRMNFEVLLMERLVEVNIDIMQILLNVKVLLSLTIEAQALNRRGCLELGLCLLSHQLSGLVRNSRRHLVATVQRIAIVLLLFDQFHLILNNWTRSLHRASELEGFVSVHVHQVGDIREVGIRGSCRRDDGLVNLSGLGFRAVVFDVL